MKPITQAIQHGVSFAYISLLIDCTNILTDPISSTVAEIDKDLNTILDDTKALFSSLDTLIGGDETSRSECVSQLQLNHKILEDKFKVINAYSRELNHISTVLENQYHLKTTKLQDIEGINYHQFIHEGLDFIAQAKDREDKIYKTKEFLRFLPMRMTKNSFIDYVKHSLENVASNPLDTNNTIFLSVFNQMFDGRLTQNYSVAFQDIAIAIEDLRNQSEIDLTGSSIEGIFDDIYLLKDTIEGLYNFIATLYQALSSISTLLILDSLNFDILCREHITFKDLFFTVKSLLIGETHGEDYTIIIETLPDRLADVLNEINENYTQSAKNFYHELEKDSLPKTQETLKLIKVFSLIRFYLQLNIEDAFSFNEAADSASQLDTSIIDSATGFLSAQLNSLKPTERKLRMQYLISMLPFTMNTQEFANYFDHALEGTSNEIQKAYVLAKLSNFMDSFGYFDTLQPTPDHHHHHEHDDQCGCPEDH